MLLRFQKDNNEGIMKYFTSLAIKHFLSSLILLCFCANPVVGNKDIPFCHKLWDDLGKDLADWRERCLDGDHEIDTPCCQADKEYFEEKRLSHRKMCFYEGSFPEPYLLAVSEKTIAVVDLTSNYSISVINGSKNIKNVLVDPIDQKIYFESGTKVYRANFDGSEKEVIHQDDGNPIRLFAFDWIGRRMFWVASKRNFLFVGNMDLRDRTMFYSSEKNISSLAVDPNAGYIFYKDIQKFLVRINFLGGDLKEFHLEFDDFSVYLDHVNKRLYYYSNKKENVYSMDYDGGLLKKFLFREMGIGKLAVFGDIFYLEKIDTRVIQQMNLSNGVVYRYISLPKSLSSLNDLVVIAKSQYPTDGCPISPCGVNEYCSNVNGTPSCKCHFSFRRNGSSCEKKSFHARFTNLGATGRLGPVSLSSHYVDKDHENMVTVHHGTQFWTVPYTGTYQIIVVGAAGGYDSRGSWARGRGAYMSGDFDLNTGDVLKILVGQEGAENFVRYSSGGGGGTFVVTLSNTPLIVAGGGGGIDKLNTRLANCDANTGTSGRQNQCLSICTIWSRGVNGKGTFKNASRSGGGGGGFYSNGRSSIKFLSKRRGGEGGRGFIQGGAGGRAGRHKAVGGFGGGGGAWGVRGGAGGGGGYSGGASGARNRQSCGGGGGSFNIGKNQQNKEGYLDNGHGYVEIELLA